MNTTATTPAISPVSQALTELRKRDTKAATRCACELVLAECHPLTKLQRVALETAIEWANGTADDRAFISAYNLSVGEDIERMEMLVCARGAVVNALDIANVHYNSSPSNALATLPLNILGSKQPPAWFESEAGRSEEFTRRCIKRISAADASL